MNICSFDSCKLKTEVSQNDLDVKYCKKHNLLYKLKSIESIDSSNKDSGNIINSIVNSLVEKKRLKQSEIYFLIECLIINSNATKDLKGEINTLYKIIELKNNKIKTLDDDCKELKKTLEFNIQEKDKEIILLKGNREALDFSNNEKDNKINNLNVELERSKKLNNLLITQLKNKEKTILEMTYLKTIEIKKIDDDHKEQTKNDMLNLLENFKGIEKMHLEEQKIKYVKEINAQQKALENKNKFIKDLNAQLQYEIKQTNKIKQENCKSLFLLKKKSEEIDVLKFSEYNKNKQIDSLNSTINELKTEIDMMKNKSEDNKNKQIDSLNSTVNELKTEIDMMKKSHQREQKSLCVICLESKAEYANVNCGHLCLCESDMNMVNRCPICLVEVDKIIKVFSS